MSHPRRIRLFSRWTAVLAGLVAGVGVALTAGAAEVVILKDGFIIQGNVRKEVTSINDPASGKSFPIVKENGLEMVDEGPKVVIYSTHAKQPGEIGPEVKLRPEYKAYTTKDGPRKGFEAPPLGQRTLNAPDFNAKWCRTLKVSDPNGFQLVDQQITYLDPYFCYIWSSTHLWRLAYRTSEMDPLKIRKLLSTHPDLAEPDGKPDPAKRVAVARFMLDVGWLQYARDDLDFIKQTFPNGVPPGVKPAYDELVKDIDTATAGLVVKEAELALHAGRYHYAGEVLAAFPEKMADAKQTARVTELMAEWKAAREPLRNRPSVASHCHRRGHGRWEGQPASGGGRRPGDGHLAHEVAADADLDTR